ncbi:hypothetical protein E1B28_009343 [Marasmius oreades]|uniref:Uncharacterized protein n=1 Tax=Marasmius oreades TaxID=181124 RepID=A0A9P7UTB5_9AGAR|nr:uncharacterized protein E1B28_009343 [Marasmius oreades]KAG7093050.1 hypothetical protein E1B28_009343 [Marasmius oreades]
MIVTSLVDSALMTVDSGRFWGDVWMQTFPIGKEEWAKKVKVSLKGWQLPIWDDWNTVVCTK